MDPASIHGQPPVEDSGRWLDFRFRPGDIVISTQRKSGTTWMQMICALLIFQTPDLPGPLWHLSPWLESPAVPREVVYAQLAAQRHRRFIKTHTPLAGIPSDPRVTYIVTARHPLDAFVSLYHQDQLLASAPVPPPGPDGSPRPPGPPGFPGPPPGPPFPPGPPPGLPVPPGPPPPSAPPPSAPPPGPPPPVPPGHPGPPPGARAPEVSVDKLHGALVEWIAAGDDPIGYSESLPGTMRLLSGAWARRGDPNVLLVHYDDLLADLAGEMRRLAERLGIAVPERSWPVLAGAATFDRMRDREDVLVPPPPGVAVDTSLFFRRGTSGAGREILSGDELAGYHARVARLAPPDLIEWLHRPVARNGRAGPSA